MSNSISNGGVQYLQEPLVSIEEESLTAQSSSTSASKTPESLQPAASGLLTALGIAHTPALSAVDKADNNDTVEVAVHDFFNDPTIFLQTLAAAISDL